MAASAADEVWVVRADGAGPLRIGMTLPQINKTLDESFTEPEDRNRADCFYIRTTKAPKLMLMMLEGRLGRIDVHEPGIKTTTGIAVGDSEAHVGRVYGTRLNVMPHKYVEKAHYLTVKPSDGRRGIRFEAANGKVTSYYAGRYERDPAGRRVPVDSTNRTR